MDDSEKQPDDLGKSASGGSDGSIRIAQPGPARLLEAVERLLRSDRRHAERFLRFAQETRMSLDHIWCAFGTSNRILATVLASPSPGRTAMLFASPPRSSEEAPLVGRVVDATCRSLKNADVALAQALVEPADRLEQDAFIHGGLLRLAMLTYMERSVPERNAILQTDFPDGVHLECYRSEHRAELEDLLVETYRDTLDCPGLAGLLDPSDVVEGHMHSGTFRPEWWVIARKGKRAIGVSLFNGSAGSSSIELVYLGLTKNARGRGIGWALLQHGLGLVAGSRERNIVLAVDEENDPALKIYEKAGFHRTIRRVALIRKLDESTTRT